jgi:hypothetical protein
MSLPIIIDANTPTKDGYVKIYITSTDPYRYGDRVVLIDTSHPFQIMGHLYDVIAESLGGINTHRIKLSISGETVSAGDQISDVIDRIKPVDRVCHLTMSVEEWVPRVYSKNLFEMRREWEMYRPVYNTSDPW